MKKTSLLITNLRHTQHGLEFTGDIFYFGLDCGDSKALGMFGKCLSNESDVAAGTFLQTEMFRSRRVFEDIFNKDPSLSSACHAVAAGSSLRLRLHHNFHRLGDLLPWLKCRHTTLSRFETDTVNTFLVYNTSAHKTGKLVHHFTIKIRVSTTH